MKDEREQPGTHRSSLIVQNKNPRPHNRDEANSPAVPPHLTRPKARASGPCRSAEVRSAKVVFNLPSLITGDEPGRNY